MSAANSISLPLADYKARHVRLAVDGKVATITLDRPDKKNPLTFESYAEIVDLFRAAAKEKAVKAFVITGAGGNFCSGGDVHEIIGPLVEADADAHLEFTRMTGAVIQAMRDCPQPIVAAVNGTAAGAGAVIALAADLRVVARSATFAFLFTKVGLAGADMGAAYLLPRVVGLGRASELLLLGDAIDAETADRYGLVTRLVDDESVLGEACVLAVRLASGPGLAYAETKRLLSRELDLDLTSAIELEAQVQASLMATQDYREFHAAFTEKREPKWEGR
jgi:enoyl-CoA hydratase/carnithine racemase